LKEAVLHETEKAGYHPQNSEKEENNIMAPSVKIKTVNNESPFTSYLAYVPQPLETCLQKRLKTGLKTQKQI
jgi:hypothetical protein